MLKFAKFIGANTDFSTAQSFIFPRILNESGDEPVFGLVISGQGEDVFVQIRQKILNLEESFSAPFERITDKLHDLLEKLKFEFRSVENLNLTLFCAKDSLFYVLQTGNNIVEILSEGNSTSVIPPNFASEKIISGFIKTGDRILVLSSKPDGTQWEESVTAAIFATPLASISDSEVLFIEEALVEEQQPGDVKNIIPVAFILLDNEAKVKDLPVYQPETGKKPRLSIPKVNFSFNAEFILPLLRKIIRQLSGALRLIPGKILIVSLLIIVIGIIGSGVYFYLKNQQEQRNLRRDNLITLINTGLTQAEVVKDTDAPKAREEVIRATERLKELNGLDPENPRVKEAGANFEARSSEILKIYKQFDLELFMSLDLIKQNFTAKKMSFSIDKILFLDENEKSLVSIGIELKSPDILAGPTQLGDAKYASINGSSAFVFSRDKGILHIDVDNNKVSVVSAPDAGWGDIKDIYGFADNVYALDVLKNMIWKYAPSGSSFSLKQEYLRSEVDLIAGKDLMIDYSVWVLTSEPDVLKFTAGNSDFYAVGGIDEPLTQIDAIYAPEELDNIFLLDKSTNKILVTKKNGEYAAQYIKPELGKVDDFFVDDQGKMIYLLLENKIYRTPLK